MSARIILKLLQKISTEKDKVHNIGLNYCKDSIKLYDDMQDYIFVKDNQNIEFNDIKEFTGFRDKIQKIKNSNEIIDEMFELDNDVNRIKLYIGKGYLVHKSQAKINNNINDVIYQAKRFLLDAKNYVFIASNEKVFLSERFEFFRIQSILTKLEENEPTEDDLRKISAEVMKLESYIKTGQAISIKKLDEEFALTDIIIEKISKLNKNFFNDDDYPKIGLFISAIKNETSYDKKANLFYKFVGKDIPNFLNIIKENIAKIQTNPSLRLNQEKENITKLRDKEIFEIETQYLHNKTSKIARFLGINKNGMTNAERKDKISEIKSKYAQKWKQVQVSIDSIIINEKSMIDEVNMQIEDLEQFLNQNIVGLKLK